MQRTSVAPLLLICACAASPEAREPEPTKPAVVPQTAIKFVQSTVSTPSIGVAQVDWTYNDLYHRGANTAWDNDLMPSHDARKASLLEVLKSLPKGCKSEFRDEGPGPNSFPPAMKEHSDAQAQVITEALKGLYRGTDIIAYCHETEQFEECDEDENGEPVCEMITEKRLRPYFAINVRRTDAGQWAIQAWTKMTRNQ